MRKVRARRHGGDIIFYGYLYQEKKCFGLDYNDLIKFSLYIFEQHEDIRLKWQQRLEYIMIDEFQDIDALQYELMEVLCGYHGNLFIVGDPDQTIYTARRERQVSAGFRQGLSKRADHHDDGKLPFHAGDFGGGELADRKKRPPHQKGPAPDEALGREGRLPLCRHAGGRGALMAGEMQRLHDRGVPLRDMTVLYRAHYVTRAVEEALMHEKIPYTIYSGVQFFDRMEIKDALSYLRMIAYQDDLSFRRIANAPKRNLGKRRMAFLQETAEKRGRASM